MKLKFYSFRFKVGQCDHYHYIITLKVIIYFVIMTYLARLNKLFVDLITLSSHTEQTKMHLINKLFKFQCVFKQQCNSQVFYLIWLKHRQNI